MDVNGFPKDFEDFLSKSYDLGSARLSRVFGRCSLGKSGRSPRGGGIGARGRRRRRRSPEYIRGGASGVPTDLYGVWVFKSIFGEISKNPEC